MALETNVEELGRLWDGRCRAWNAHAARVASIFGFTLVPLFGFLDWIVAREVFFEFLAIRLMLAAYSLFVFTCYNRDYFRRHVDLFGVALVVGVALAISAMVFTLGGFISGYYAGINLVMLAAGLLFLWDKKIVALTYGLIVLSYLAPNAWKIEEGAWSTTISNIFFLVSTAIIVSIGQVVTYRSQYRQFATELSLQKAKDGIEKAHDQLKQLDRFKSQFFANITHELKTPLAMILSPLELMTSGDMGRFSEEQNATIHTMYRNGMKLLKLIEDLLDLSRLEESRIRLRVADNDLVAYLRGLVQSVMPLAQRKRIEMVFESDVDRAVVAYDQDRMERVLVNLLSNAAKFTPEGGHIRVRLHDAPDRVHVSVIDDGPGFPADKAERVFERFYQVDMAGTRKHGGTGIGLALAKELVNLHGGRIWAESEAGKGAAFHVHLRKGREHFRPEVLERRVECRDLPGGKRSEDAGIMDWAVQLTGRDDYRLLEIAEATERRIVERDADEASRPFTVLVVEDTPDVIRLVHMSLRQHFRILAAGDGLKGLDLARRLRPDLVITDYMMPGIDGMELARRVRQDPSLKAVPIIMLTARGDIEDRVAGMESGVNLYLTKPFHPKELLQSVRTLLNIEGTHADLLLAQQVDSLEKVASGMAHEINNPLNYIKNAVSQVRADVAKVMALMQGARGRELSVEEAGTLAMLEGRLRKMFETADAGVRRISGTVDLMRKYSREGYARRIEPFDLFGAVNDVIDIVLPATGRDVRVEADLPGQAIVECVPEEILQVLTNLVQNAIEAAPEGSGRVRIRGVAQDGMVTLSVKDNGPGIPRDQRDRIFTPFFTTKGPGKGMGLGLTIVWRVLHSLNGTIEVGSEEGAGAEFVVRIPRTQPRSDGPAA